jgi:CubicO group peptidase (beta-lactamase class C family)
MAQRCAWYGVGLSLAAASFWAPGGAAPSSSRDVEIRTHIAAMAAHDLCAGVYIVGREMARSPERVLAEDIRPLGELKWQADFEYRVEEGKATVWGSGVAPQTARYNGDQGCTILPEGETQVYFEPLELISTLPDPSTQPWPTGDVGARAPLPREVDAERLEAALDWAMTQKQHHTRAVVVAYQGKIIGERYAPGFTKDTPQISFSQGKSIVGALIGILIQRGDLKLDDPAPVSEWQEEGDPRPEIHIRDLLHMSSGLNFKNYSDDRARRLTKENEHLRVYFDAINVYEHAVQRPFEIPPSSQFRYRNSDPLALGGIIRQIVEAQGEDHLGFPQRALFDRIGARNFVLEPDAWGNFIYTGYDFGSAWDWVRFGLLHLWDGVWEGECILPAGWVKFVTTPAPGDPRLSYGGLFWLNRGGIYGQAPEDAFWAAGAMGQITMIIPSQDLVIVRLGISPDTFRSYFNEVVGKILAAFQSN